MPSSRKRRRARLHRGEIAARFRVRCSGKLHWILLTGQGRLVLSAHPDLAAEDVVAAMTGEACRCMQIQKQWCEFVKHGTQTMRLVDLPRELQQLADDAHSRNRIRIATRKIIQDTNRAYFLSAIKENLATKHKDTIYPETNYPQDRSHERLNALKKRITLEITAKAEYYAETIIANSQYHIPHHIYPKFEAPNITVTPNIHSYRSTASTFCSYDEGLRSHDAEFHEFGVRRRYSLQCTKPIQICLAFIMTKGVARDIANNTRVAVVGLLRPKKPGLRADQEIAYAGRQNDVTSVVRTQRCLLRRGEAGWEVAEWLPEEAD